MKLRTIAGITVRLGRLPIALHVYHNFDRFYAAKRLLWFKTEVVKYGAETGVKSPANYGASRHVHIGGDTTWPSENTTGVFVPASVLTRHRSGGGVRDPEEITYETDEPMPPSISVAEDIAKAIKDARKDESKFVLEHHGFFSHSFDPSKIEPDNDNACHDAKSNTLYLIVAEQSPYEVARVAAAIVKDNKRFPVETITLLTGTTVGYSPNDHFIFSVYAITTCFYGDGLPVHMALSIGLALIEELPLYEDGSGNGTWIMELQSLYAAA